jgi:hypothetical protein
MPSPTGWREVPCVECGEFVAGIDFGDRCPTCLKRRQQRAALLARRVALVATALAGAWVVTHLPTSPLGRWYAVLAVPITYLLVRLIVVRFAMEVLP